jgi:hypothetical protein
MSEKVQVRKSMFSVQNMEELGRLFESDTPVLAYDFKRRMVERRVPEDSRSQRDRMELLDGSVGASGRGSCKRLAGENFTWGGCRCRACPRLGRL